MQIKAERAKYNNQYIIKLIFDYDIEVISRIRAISGTRWSRAMRCWHVADQPQKIAALQNIRYQD